MEEKKTSIATITMVYGAILGIVLIVFSLILFLLDLSMNKGVAWISYVLLLGGIIIAQLNFRKKYLDGYITFGKAFMVGFLTTVFASILIGIYTYINVKYIDPGLIEQMMAQSEKRLMDLGMSDTEIEQGLAMTEFMRSPVIMSISALLISAFFGAILSLLAAIFTKKESQNVTPIA